MKFIELSKSLSTLAPIYLISGEDRYLCYNALSQIKNAMNLQMPELSSVSLSQTDAEQIVTSCNVFPFVDAKRLVVVNDFCPKANDKKQKEIIEKYINSPMQSTVLVFFNLEDDLFFKAYKDKITCIDCNKLEPATIINYIIKQFEKNGINCPPNVANLIDMYCLSDMQRITGEIDKIVAYLGDSKAVTEEIVSSLVVQDKEYQIYSLTEYIAKNDSIRALDLVEVLGRKGNLSILASLYSAYRRLLYVCISPFNEQELAKMLGVKEFAVKMMKNQVRLYTPKKLKRIVDYLKDLDSGIKKGKIKEDVTAKLAVIQILKIRNM